MSAIEYIHFFLRLAFIAVLAVCLLRAHRRERWDEATFYLLLIALFVWMGSDAR